MEMEFIMNERIRELALQALKHPDNDNDGLTVFDNDELKKFAELIVKECCTVADEVEKADVLFLASKFIKIHFGVE